MTQKNTVSFARSLVLVAGALSLVACGGVESQEPTAQAEGVNQCAAAQGLGELAVLSCQLQAPVDEAGYTAADKGLSVDADREVTAQACNTYYGTCSGPTGCSMASGEGYSVTNCGNFIYSWMTICNGTPSSWGIGACIF